jgi:transcription initiation factor TFIIIB Brf1 subunit/transcription initiation factor TFIIB
MSFVAGYSRLCHVPPTLQEIAVAVGVSKSQIWEALRYLNGHGYVNHWPGKARTLTITARGWLALDKAARVKA